MAANTKLIVNLTSDRCVCIGELADRPLARMRGLMGRRALPAGEGLLLRPAPGIHTAFMRFPIDAVFLDGEMCVVRIVSRLRPWRIAVEGGARAVLELPSGECARRGVEVGDRLAVRDRERPLSDREPRPLAPSATRWRKSSDSIIWPSEVGHAAEGLRQLHPLRVLIASDDRHFRSVMTTLLGRHGCSVSTTAHYARIAGLSSREDVDVVVVDGGSAPAGADAAVAALGGLAKPVGVVVMGEQDVQLGPGRRALPKWGPFEELFEAIELADGERHGRAGAA